MPIIKHVLNMYWRDDFEIISHEYELYTNQMTHCYYFSGFETATSWQNLIYAVSFNRHLVEHFDLIADNQWMETTMSGDKNQISHWWIHTNQFLLHKKNTLLPYDLYEANFFTLQMTENSFKHKLNACDWYMVFVLYQMNFGFFLNKIR